jgi:hypothetical protein
MFKFFFLETLKIETLDLKPLVLHAVRERERERVCVCVIVWERAGQAEVMADDHASSVRPLRVLEFYSGIGGMVRSSVSPSVFMFSLCQFGCV